MEFQFEFHLSLRRLTMVRIAALLWKQPSVEEKVKHLVINTVNASDRSLRYPSITYLNKCIIATSLKLLGRTTLPIHLLNELHIVVKSMGQKIYNWYMHIAELYDDDLTKTISCMGKICWTHYGCIDSKKTFELTWLGNAEFSQREVFAMACNYCIEEHIQSSWQPMSKYFQTFPLDCLADYWQSKLSGNLQTTEALLNENYECYAAFGALMNMDPPRMFIPVNIFMFWLAIYRGYNEAVEYFWQSMTDECRKTYVFPLLAHLESENFDHTEQYVETYSFLLSRITSEYPLNIYETNPCVPKLLLYLMAPWPWYDLFIPNLQKLWTLPKLWDSKYGGTPITKFLRDVERLEQNYDLEEFPFPITDLMQLVWQMTPKPIKLLCDRQSFEDFLFDSLQYQQLEIAKLIINDEDMKVMRNELTVSVAQKCRNHPFGRRLCILDDFLNATTESVVKKMKSSSN